MRSTFLSFCFLMAWHGLRALGFYGGFSAPVMCFRTGQDERTIYHSGLFRVVYLSSSIYLDSFDHFQCTFVYLCVCMCLIGRYGLGLELELGLGLELDLGLDLMIELFVNMHVWRWGYVIVDWWLLKVE